MKKFSVVFISAFLPLIATASDSRVLCAPGVEKDGITGTALAATRQAQIEVNSDIEAWVKMGYVNVSAPTISITKEGGLPSAILCVTVTKP